MQIFGDMMGACVKVKILRVAGQPKILYHGCKCGSTTGLVAPSAARVLATFSNSAVITLVKDYHRLAGARSR